MKTGGAVSSFDPRIQEEKKEVEREDKNPHDVKCTPFFYAKPAVEKPLATCLFFCGGLLIFFMILVGLTVAGVEVIRFTIDVPFYLYDYKIYKEYVAILSAFDVASARLDEELREREQLIGNFQLTVVYESEDGGTLFDPDLLARIKDMEESIVAVTDYTKFCALKYDFDENDPICVRQYSAVSFFDPGWWVPAIDPPPNPTVPSEYNAQLVMNQSTIAAFDMDHYYAFGRELPNNTVNSLVPSDSQSEYSNIPDPQDIDGVDNVNLSQDNINDMVEYWARYCSDADDCPTAANEEQSPYAMTISGYNVTVSSELVSIVDTDFSIQGDEVETTAKALQTVFYFGSPQYDEDEGELYAVDTEGMVDQQEELGSFLLDEVADILEDGLDGIGVFWTGDGNGMLEAYVDSILSSDMMQLAYSILFIAIYLVFQLQSWWLGLVGILMILGNFGPSLIVYRAVYGSSYFGTMNALSVFLALGIGADDIFVFANTWKYIRRSHPEMPVVLQLEKALSIGGKAMLVTSLTTAISFFVNASSHFPAVESFGIFSAVLILCNFVLVITLFPAAYMVYECYMHDPSKKQGFWHTTCHTCFKRPAGYSGTQVDGDWEKGGILARFFQHRLYPFLHRFRVASLLIYAVVIATYITIGSRLEPDSEAARFLPEEDQYMQVADKLDIYFSHSDVSDAITVKIPFGIAGIDRDDCDGDPCDPTIDTDYGAPIWDTGIQDLSNEYTQKWFLDFCDAIESATETDSALMIYEADESNPTPVSCPFWEFKTWCEQGTGRCNQSHVLGEDEYIVDASAFDETFQTFLMDELVVSSANVLSTVSTNYDLWDGQIRYEEDLSTGETTLRYVSIEVLLNARFDLDFSDGINLYHDWGDFVDEWKALATSEEYQGADTSVSSGFVNDAGIFHWFFLQERIIKEAFTGIALSLLGAFIIVFLATSNWRVSAMAIFTIATMVGGVVTFTVLNGWKLGVLDAVLFVMVVGFSVDYTIHLSDAYLESDKATRTERTQEMLAIMGPSVLSGAISTLGACFPLLFSYLVFFLKFGAVIFFIIMQSLVFSIIFYATMLDVMGPEARAWGKNLKKGRQVLVKMDEIADPGTKGFSEAHSNCRNGEEPMGEFSPGKVLATDGETCTVLVEDDVGEVSVPVSHCKLRYEAGHAPLVDSCKGAIRRALKGCCQKLQRKSAVEIGPKQVHGENAT